ncbi:hypothetical protein [Hoeflea sp.]|uniref:hypothetical protein n=1 Tax=Hoeflea sp. TaxID=1940281 RepID=UPI002B000DDF|nr:hypothetical protein [Hoeflea sp.]
MQLFIPVANRVLLRQRDDANARLIGEPVFEKGNVGTDKRDYLLAVLEVQQPVSQRKIKQLTLPAVNAASCGGRLFFRAVGRH